MKRFFATNIQHSGIGMQNAFCHFENFREKSLRLFFI